MAVPVRVGTPTVNGGSGTSLSIDKPTSGVTVQNDDALVVFVRGQATATGTTPASITGFTAGHNQALTDRVHMILYKRVTDAGAEPSSYTINSNAGSGRLVAAMEVWRGVDWTNPIAGTQAYSALAASTTQTLTSWSLDDTGDAVALILFSDERTSGQSHVPTSTPSGWTTEVNVQSSLDDSTSGSRTFIWAGSRAFSGTTTVPDATLVMPTGFTTPRGSGIALRGKTDAPTPIGVEVTLGDGSPAYLSYINEEGDRVAPSAVRIWYPGFPTVDDLLARTDTPTSAHRGGSGVWPEFSEYAYDHAVTAGFGILEFSCGWTSDNVPFGLGDETLDRAAGLANGTNLNPQSISWATLSSTYENKLRPVKTGVFQPFYRLEDFLAKYHRTHVLLVDPKYGFDNLTKLGVMLDMCDQYGGPDKIIIKFDSPTGTINLQNAAHARGYLCMNYWNEDMTALASQQATWDILGLNYQASSANWSTLLSYGKPTWGAIIPNQAGYETVKGYGATFAMVTNPATIKPVSYWNG